MKSFKQPETVQVADPRMPLNSLLFDRHKSILHISSGSNYGKIGSRVFAFWRQENRNNIFIASPFSDKATVSVHACTAGTYNTYKMVVSPHESDSEKSVVELFINGKSVSKDTGDKVRKF